jgi:pimeloyl-ACP methyl ester carboxylesterase
MLQHQTADLTHTAPVNVVLIHGAFADGSSWNKVIPLLEYAGYQVTAVQNPLTSFVDDIATSKRVIDAQSGPVVVVGHSYGGAVLTNAARGNTRVKALVFIAAFAPDAGEVISAGAENFAPPPLGSALVSDAAGFLSIERAKFHDTFAADLPTTEARIMAATQKPIFGAIFAATTQDPAWKSIPSWYLVATEDHAINPDFERFLAKRICATTTEVKSSHALPVAQPDAVFRVIDNAVKVTTQATVL